jgi:predicted transcriptional regulator
MITVGQVKAARALLGWRQVDLAAMAGLSEVSIKNFEREATDSRGSTLNKIESALAKAGVEFIINGVKLNRQEAA